MTVDAWAFGPDRAALRQLVDSFLNGISIRLQSLSYSIAFSYANDLRFVDPDKSRWLQLDQAEDFWRERFLFLCRLPD